MATENTKERILFLLRSTQREGIEDLIAWMEDNGFFTAPCSTDKHLCKEGGLAVHSLNVYETFKDFVVAVDKDWSLENSDSIKLCCLLHDIGKVGDHDKAYYIPNILKSGKPSESKPYVVNPDLTYEEHEIRSALIIERFIKLTEDEESAILHHNGLFSKLDSSYGNANFCKTKLAFLLHTADMWCSRFVETKTDDELPWVEV